jgi:hypothetical protein
VQGRRSGRSVTMGMAFPAFISRSYASARKRAKNAPLAPEALRRASAAL